MEASGIPYVIFRPSFIFGEGGGILPTFAKLAKIGPVTPSPARDAAHRSRSGSTTSAQFFAESVTRDDVLDRPGSSAARTRSTGTTSGRGSRRTLGVKRRPTVHMPMWFMRANAVVTERLPGNIPLTRDLLKMLEAGDNVTTDDSAAETFGVKLMPLTSSCAAAPPRKNRGRRSSPDSGYQR